MKKRILSLLLAFALCLSLLPALPSLAAGASYLKKDGSPRNAGLNDSGNAGISANLVPESTSAFTKVLDGVKLPNGTPATSPSSASPSPGKTAYATSYAILVNGQTVHFDAYALRDETGDTNYLKLRDVAYVLNGSASQFDVGYDDASRSITLTTGKAYANPNGTEMSTPFSGNQPYKESSSAVLVNGVQTALSAITLTDANGGGYTYFKLRDLGEALGFSVDWDAAAGSIVITTAPAGTGASTQPMDANCTQLLKLINDTRSQAGLKPLGTTDQLTQAAQIRAGEISNAYFETRPDGSGWETVLAQAGVSATETHESILDGSSAADVTFFIAMNDSGARSAILSADLTHIGIGYAYNANGYGGYTDFWSLLYIREKASAAGNTGSSPASGTPDSGSASFTPVPMAELANRKSLQKKATDDEFAQAYAAALEIVKPLAGLPLEDQLQGIAAALRARFDSGMEYSMTSEHYNDPYGYLILGSASCAGCTRATGLCLNILGIPYEHVNEDEYSHQWCRVNVNGTYWICDAYGLYCGPEPAPYLHPYF